VKNYTALDLIKGYQTDQVTKWLNTGNFTAGNLYVSDIVTPTLNTFLGPSSELQWNMLMGRGTTDGKVNVTMSELGSTLGATGSYGYVSIPVRMWNGVTGEWVMKSWFDEAERSPPKFATVSNQNIYNVKFIQ